MSSQVLESVELVLAAACLELRRVQRGEVEEKRMRKQGLVTCSSSSTGSSNQYSCIFRIKYKHVNAI